MYECNICSRYARKTLAEIMCHIREAHPHFEGPVRCGIEGCPSTIKSYESLRQHVYRKHKHVLKPSDPGCMITSSNDTIGSAVPSEAMESSDSFTADPTSTSPSCLEQQHPSLAAAQFIMKMRDGRKLPQTTLDIILQDTRQFLDQTVENLGMSVKNSLEGLNKLTADEISEVLSHFTVSGITNPFEGLESQYKQEKFFLEHCNYVVSEQ